MIFLLYLSFDRMPLPRGWSSGAPAGEMWMAHAVFYGRCFAVCLCAPTNLRGATAVFVGLLALLFTHEGAIVFSAAILCPLRFCAAGAM